jgi:hypothetical protein
MPLVDIDIEAGTAHINGLGRPGRSARIEVGLTDIEVDDLVKAVGVDALLECIGQDECVKYFGLTLKD